MEYFINYNLGLVRRGKRKMIDLKKAREICEAASRMSARATRHDYSIGDYWNICDAVEEVLPEALDEIDKLNAENELLRKGIGVLPNGIDHEAFYSVCAERDELETERNALRKRLELAEKVCEAADKWDSRDQHSLIPDTSDPAVKLGAALEEWRKGDGK